MYSKKSGFHSDFYSAKILLWQNLCTVSVTVGQVVLLHIFPRCKAVITLKHVDLLKRQKCSLLLLEKEQLGVGETDTSLQCCRQMGKNVPAVRQQGELKERIFH